MGSIVVDVMLKPEILDPQGQAVGGALPRLGFDGFTDVRQGKRFVLTVEGDVTEEHLAAAREAADKLLSNPVIEDVVSVHVLESADGDAAARDAAADIDDAEADTADGEGADGEAAPEEAPDAAGEDESK
jgi:phosphoribosylformylglycinamidine synthase